MRFSIRVTASAIKDLEHYKKSERRIISGGIALLLSEDANVETKRRKALRPNRLAQWELRIGRYRVFYDFEEEDLVKIVAVGHKEHNDLYIRSRKVNL